MRSSETSTLFAASSDKAGDDDDDDDDDGGSVTLSDKLVSSVTTASTSLECLRRFDLHINTTRLRTNSTDA